MYYCAFCFTISRWTNDDHYKCMHFSSDGLILVFVCLFVFVFTLLFQKKKATKKSSNLEKKKKSLFGGLFVFAMNIKSFFFFSYFHWCDFRRYRAQSDVFFIYIYLFIPCIFFYFFPCKQLVLQDLEHTEGGEELLPYLTLRRCWKQRLEEKGRHKGGEERSYHGESDYSWERPVRQQSAVNTNTKKQKKTLQETLPETYFLFEHSWRRLLGCRERKRERERERLWCCCDLTKHKRCIILQYLQINIVTHGVCITSANSVTFSELMQRGVVFAEPH